MDCFTNQSEIPSKINSKGLKRVFLNSKCIKCLEIDFKGHGGAVVTHSPPACEVCSSNPRSYVGKLAVPYRWCAVYSTEP